MSNHKVLQVIDRLEVGGAERVFVDLTNLLYENGTDVSALFLLESGRLAADLDSRVRGYELDRKSKFSLSAARKAAAIIKSFDVVHCHSRHVYRYVRLIQKVFNINAKIILHDHFGSIKVDKNVPSGFRGFLKPHYYIGVSRELTEWARRELNLEQNKIFLLENIVRKQKTLEHSEKGGIVLVSNIKPLKNQRFVFELLSEISEPLTLIGGVQDEDYFLQLKKLTEKQNNVSFLTRVHNVQPELNRFRLGLHTSKSETGPLVLIEYLAQGLPFLAYSTGEVAQILHPYFPQYFIDNFDKEKWIERINFLLIEKPDKRKMAEVFDCHFGSRNYSEKCLKIYANINS